MVSRLLSDLAYSLTKKNCPTGALPIPSPQALIQLWYKDKDRVPGCFVPPFAKGSGWLWDRAALCHGSSGECHWITSNTILHRCHELFLEALSGQACLTSRRGCSSWGTPRQCSLLLAMSGSGIHLEDSLCTNAPSPPHCTAGLDCGTEPCCRAQGQVSPCQPCSGHMSGLEAEALSTVAGALEKLPAPTPEPYSGGKHHSQRFHLAAMRDSICFQVMPAQIFVTLEHFLLYAVPCV